MCVCVCVCLSDAECLAISPVCVASMLSSGLSCLEKMSENVFCGVCRHGARAQPLQPLGFRTQQANCVGLSSRTDCHKNTFSHFPMEPRELRFGLGMRKATTASANAWAGSAFAAALSASAAASFFFKAAMTFANCSSSPVTSGCFTDFRLLEVAAASKHLATSSSDQFHDALKAFTTAKTLSRLLVWRPDCALMSRNTCSKVGPETAVKPRSAAASKIVRGLPQTR